MSSNVNWANPYAVREGKWYKGNLHTHTSPASGCGRISVEDSLDLYVKNGYDFVSISDHCTYTKYEDDRIMILPGTEWNATGGKYHTGVYSLDVKDIDTAIGLKDQDELLDALKDTNAVVILNHPNWQLRPHYRREELDQKDSYDGVEIFNAVIERLQGYAISTDKWDYLLINGKKTLGFASDDSHCTTDIGIGSIHVRAKSCSQGDIISSIKSGNFYCSSGALIDDIRMENGIIEIDTPDAQEIQVRADGGKMVSRVNDKSIKFDTNECDFTYVRFAVFGSGSKMAWTQPFFLK